MSNYCIGDHLVTNIDILGLVEHHGIYVGQGKVVHLSARHNGVVRTSTGRFSAGGDIRVKKSASNPHIAVERANSMIGGKGYSLITNNCEQFVNYCIHGKKTSNQISNAAHAITHLTARAGMLGKIGTRTATGLAGGIAIVSTGVKYTGEFVGLPDSVNTVLGAPGDLIAKPLESIIMGIFDTTDKVVDELSYGNILDAAGTLVEGTGSIALSAVEASFDVVGDTFDAICSWFD